MSWWNGFSGPLTAFNPTAVALQQSGAMCRKRDANARIQNAADLIALYRGDQLQDALRDIAYVFTDPKILARYQKHADTFNVTALVVDRVATLGRDPIKVEWLDADGNPSPPDAALWDEIADANGWDGFMQSAGQQLELLASIVLAAQWDPALARVCLYQYTPNILEVRSTEGDERHPDQYRIFEDDGRYQIWDFSGETLQVGYGRGWEIEEPVPLDVPLIDPATKEALVPFVPLRMAYPADGYWTDKGQEDLLTSNRRVNRLLTQLAVILHYGAYQIPIGEGPGWNVSRDKELPVVIDVGELLIVPDSTLSDKPTTIKWAGPANEAFIDKHHEAVRQKVAFAAASRGIDPSFIRVEGGQERSGVSLWIGNQALVERQKNVKTFVRAPLRRFVEVIRTTQNAFGGEKQFTEGATFRITIPEVQFAQEPKDKIVVDKAVVDAGFRRKKDLVREWNPGWTDKEIDDFLAESAPAAVPSLFRSRPAEPGNPLAPRPGVPPAPPTRG